MRVLVIDIGGSHVKAFATGRKGHVAIPSGPQLTPKRMVTALRASIKGWRYDVVSIGYPGRVQGNQIWENAPNLGEGWLRYDLRRAFRKPVKILNDAAMQALGSYCGGRMLFLGLGTGLGSTLILEGVVHATEMGDLPYCRGKSYAEFLGKAGLKRLGKAAWRRHVKIVLNQLKAALQIDYVVLGGGQAKLVGPLPQGVIRGDNSRAFTGGVRAWKAARRRKRTKFDFI